MDWALIGLTFLIGLLQDSCYSIETTCLAHGRIMLACIADWVGMIVNRIGVLVFGMVGAAAVIAHGGILDGLPVVLAAATGGAIGTLVGATLSGRLEKGLGKEVPHRFRPRMWLPGDNGWKREAVETGRRQ